MQYYHTSLIIIKNAKRIFERPQHALDLSRERGDQFSVDRALGIEFGVECGDPQMSSVPKRRKNPLYSLNLFLFARTNYFFF